MSKHETTNFIHSVNEMLTAARTGLKLLNITDHRSTVVMAMVTPEDGDRPMQFTINSLRYDEIDELIEFTDWSASKVRIATESLYALTQSSAIGILTNDHAIRVSEILEHLSIVDAMINPR